MAKLPEIKVNLELDKIAKGIVIGNLFNQVHVGLIRFDKETKTLLVNENILMQIIQFANPLQEPRKLKLVSQDEWFGRNE